MYRELLSNSHIGFDPDYEVIKKRDPLLKRLLMSRWLTLLSSSYKKQFRVILMSQNRVVVENKTIFQTRTQSHIFLVLLLVILDNA